MESARAPRKPWVRGLRYLGGGALVLVASFVAFRVGLAWMVGNAKEWCEGAAVQIEEWREAHGRYPASLQEAGLLHGRPLLCREGLLYVPWDDHFVLDFSEFLMIGWAYDSRDPSWTRYD